MTPLLAAALILCAAAAQDPKWEDMPKLEWSSKFKPDFEWWTEGWDISRSERCRLPSKNGWTTIAVPALVHVDASGRVLDVVVKQVGCDEIERHARWRLMTVKPGQVVAPSDAARWFRTQVNYGWES